MTLYALPPAPLTLVQLLEDLAGATCQPERKWSRHNDIPATEGRGYIGRVCHLNFDVRLPPRLRDESPWD